MRASPGPPSSRRRAPPRCCRRAGARASSHPARSSWSVSDGPRARRHHAGGADAGADIGGARDARDRVPHRQVGGDLGGQGLLLRPVRAGLAGGGAVGGHRLARGAAAVVGALGDGALCRRHRPRRRDLDERSLPRRHASQRRHHHLSRVRRRAARVLPGRARALAGRGRHGAGQHVGQGHRDLPGGRAHPAGEDHDGRAAQRGGARHPARQHARARRAARRLPCRHRRLPRGGDAHPRADRALGPRRADGGGAARSRPGRGAHEEVHRRPARRHLPLRGLSGDLSRRRVRAAAAAAGAHHRRRPHDRGLHGRGDRRCRCPSTRRWRCRRPPSSSR